MPRYARETAVVNYLFYPFLNKPQQKQGAKQWYKQCLHVWKAWRVDIFVFTPLSRFLPFSGFTKRYWRDLHTHKTTRNKKSA